MRAVLHHLHYAFKLSALISHRNVQNVYEHFRFIDPEFDSVLFAASEFLNYFFHGFNRIFRMAVFDIPTYHSLASRKYSVLCITVKCNQLVFIHIGYIHRKVLKQQIYLIEAQNPLFYIHRRIFSPSTLNSIFFKQL